MGEPDVSSLMSVAEAIAVLDGAPVAPRVVTVPLATARGLRLAQDLAADRDYPPFDKSLMDGYAVRCADVATVPVELTVAGEVAAGAWPARAVGPGEAVAVMTGAPLPPAADGVVPVEDVRRIGATAVEVLRGTAPGRYIARRGSDCAAGTVVLRRGDVLGPAPLAVAAGVGAAQVRVFDAPRVAVLGTGDELIAVDAEPGPSQIRNSNNLMLVALLERLGCRLTDLGTARDEPGAIRRKVEEGLGHDVLFVTGGMSMGEYDYVPRVLIELGVDLHVTKLRIKPGKPFVFGTRGDSTSYVFGLPGNPVSAFVCTLRLASRLLARLGGGEAADGFHLGTLAAALPANGPREFYQPAVLDGRGESAPRVRPLEWRGSADVYTLARAGALIVRPENAPALPEGSEVSYLRIP